MKGWVEKVYSKPDQRLIAEAKKNGLPFPDVEPRGYRARYRLGGRNSDTYEAGTYKTEESAWEALCAKEEELERRDASDIQIPFEIDGRSTLGEFMPVFVEFYVNTEMKPGTRPEMVKLLDRLIIPDLGPERLIDLNTLALLNWSKNRLRTTPRPTWAPRDRRRFGELRKQHGLPYPRSQKEARQMHRRFELPLPAEWKPCGESQARHATSLVKTMLECVKEWGILPVNHAASLKVKRGRVNVPPDMKGEPAHPPVAPEVLEWVRLHQPPRDRCMTLWFYLEGTRPSEGAALAWRQIRDFESGHIHAEAKIVTAMSGNELSDTKTNKVGPIIIFDPVRDALTQWWDELTALRGREPNPWDPVFPNLGSSSKREHMAASTWAANFATACDRAGVEGIPVYCLRSTAIALLAAGGSRGSGGEPWPLAEVALQMGHSQQTCEQWYYARLPEHDKYRNTPIEDTARRCQAEARSMATQRVFEEARRRRTILRLAETSSVPKLIEGLKSLWPADEVPTVDAVRRLLQEQGVRAKLNQEAAEVEAIILRLAGPESPPAIARYLNARGYRTQSRTLWSRQAVAAVIKRRA